MLGRKRIHKSENYLPVPAGYPLGTIIEPLGAAMLGAPEFTAGWLLIMPYGLLAAGTLLGTLVLLQPDPLAETFGADGLTWP